MSDNAFDEHTRMWADEIMGATVRCIRCGHPPDWHRLDDSTNVSPTDPAAEFRCIGYDCEAPGPWPAGGRACDCPDYAILAGSSGTETTP
jgi:hypothetical protein